MAKRIVMILLGALGLSIGFGVHAEGDASYTVRLMTPEIALQAAKVAMSECRRLGYQVAVAVVDRSGDIQVLMRDRLAAPYATSVASDKAWTAANFRLSTRDLVEATSAGSALSGLRQTPKLLAVAGGLPVEAAGSTLGAIGVAGAPTGTQDESCASAGLRAIEDEVNL